MIGLISRGEALKGDGTVVGWGRSDCQLNIPAGLSGVIAIAAGYNHSLALKGDGTVVAWGSNSSGQTTLPVGLAGVTAISANYSDTLVLMSQTDSTPPVITPNVSGILGNNGWYVGNVTVNWTALVQTEPKPARMDRCHGLRRARRCSKGGILTRRSWSYAFVGTSATNSAIATWWR
jgi:hypothetical protein